MTGELQLPTNAGAVVGSTCRSPKVSLLAARHITCGDVNPDCCMGFFFGPLVSGGLARLFAFAPWLACVSRHRRVGDGYAGPRRSGSRYDPSPLGARPVGFRRHMTRLRLVSCRGRAPTPGGVVTCIADLRGLGDRPRRGTSARYLVHLFIQPEFRCAALRMSPRQS
jgi:hypothetical protein